MPRGQNALRSPEPAENAISSSTTGKGCSVASVESALEWLRENEPGVILLDIFMPGVNGLEVLRALKKDRPKAQVLVISGFADEELERKVKALGAVDCLRKPFDFATLHTIVASRLGQRARRSSIPPPARENFVRAGGAPTSRAA